MKWVMLLVLIIACSPPPAEKRVIQTDGAPAAIGPYSQGIVVGNRMYCAGQIAIDPTDGRINDESIESETAQVLKNIDAVLSAGGFSKTDVVQVQVFLDSLSHFSRFNTVYANFFGDHKPVRAAVEAAKLPRNARIEIMVVAEK